MLNIKEILLCTYQANLDMVELAWSSGMAWWIASLLFCATLTSRLYMARESLIDKGLRYPVGVLVAICFLSMISFGLVVIHDLTIIEATTYQMLIHEGNIFDVPNISAIFIMVRKLYTIITASISIFLIVWLYIWFANKPFTLNN